MPWRKHLRTKALDNAAIIFIEIHGAEAYSIARKQARLARDKKDHKRARHFAHLALLIADLTEREVGLANDPR
jgi:hypothetical protein